MSFTGILVERWKKYFPRFSVNPYLNSKGFESQLYASNCGEAGLRLQHPRVVVQVLECQLKTLNNEDSGDWSVLTAHGNLNLKQRPGHLGHRVFGPNLCRHPVFQRFKVVKQVPGNRVMQDRKLVLCILGLLVGVWKFDSELTHAEKQQFILNYCVANVPVMIPQG